MCTYARAGSRGVHRELPFAPSLKKLGRRVADKAAYEGSAPPIHGVALHLFYVHARGCARVRISKRNGVSPSSVPLAVPHAASFHGVAKILLSLRSTSVPRFAGEREEKEKFPPQLEEKNFLLVSHRRPELRPGRLGATTIPRESQPSWQPTNTMKRSQPSGDTMVLSKRCSCVCPACKRSDGPCATTHA